MCMLAPSVAREFFASGCASILPLHVKAINSGTRKFEMISRLRLPIPQRHSYLRFQRAANEYRAISVAPDAEWAFLLFLGGDEQSHTNIMGAARDRVGRTLGLNVSLNEAEQKTRCMRMQGRGKQEGSDGN